MPYRPAQRKQARKEITITFDGEPVKVWYRPGVMTPRFLEEAASTEDTSADRLARMIEKLIAAWEVVDEDGNQMLPTAATAMDFEVSFLRAVIDGVAEAMLPGEASAVSSVAS